MKNKKASFAFSYGSTTAKACYAFFISDGKCHADYVDESGIRHTYSDKAAPADFWEKLTAVAEEYNLFSWKAPKLFRRFVLDLSTGVLNVEAVFPDGRKLEANSMNGDPENLKEAAAAVRALFAELE